MACASPRWVEMLQGYSIELNPRQARVVEEAADRLDPGTEVFLPWIPGANPMDLITPAARLRRAGLYPRPHIAARHIESAAQLERLVARLVGEAAVDRILLIAGDRHRPAGPYDSSLRVMKTGTFQRAGVMRMAVSGFPEGNHHISGMALDEVLSAKVEFARRSGLELSIVTQFCFTAEPIVEWLRGIRARAIDAPVRVGLAGPAGLMTLARYALRCGIGNSLQVLTENPRFSKLLVDQGPEPIMRGIARLAEEGGTALGIAGLHFYAFGGFNHNLDWIDASRLTPEPCANL